MAHHAEFLPSPAVDGVLLTPDILSTQQYSYRFARYHPTTDTNRNTRVLHFAPGSEQALIFFEIDIAMFAEVRTKEYHFVRMLFLHRGSAGRENGVYSANAVAHLPRCFKYIIRIEHTYSCKVLGAIVRKYSSGNAGRLG